MSMSEMSKERYQALRLSVRTNGLAYTIRTMCNCLEAGDIRVLFTACSVDALAERARYQETEGKRLAFKFTVCGGALRKMLARHTIAITQQTARDMECYKLPLP